MYAPMCLRKRKMGPKKSHAVCRVQQGRMTPTDSAVKLEKLDGLNFAFLLSYFSPMERRVAQLEQLKGSGTPLLIQWDCSRSTCPV
jgi:hypothetical protein